MIGLVLNNWKALLAAGLLVGAGFAVWKVDRSAYDRGYQARVAEEQKLIREKTDAANRADDAARRCAADPACRLSDDGWRRD